MTHSDELDWVLLTRYVTGGLSPEEKDAADRLLAADPRHRAALDELREVWRATGGELGGWDVERAVARLRARALPSFVMPFAQPRRSRAWLPIAAVIAAVVAGVILFRPQTNERTPARIAKPTTIETRTARGEQREFRLRDGTRVLLAAASAIKYDSDYGVRHRTVDLEGEAFFEASHEGAGRFEVRTPMGVATDIGTAFVVRAHRAGPMHVVVTEGSVVLRATRDSLVLGVRQLGRVLANGKLELLERVDTAVYLSWTRGQLAFRNAPLSDVAEELTRWYGADVRVSNARVAQRRFTGSFTRGTVEDAVRLIAAVADVSLRPAGTAWIFE